MRRTIVKPVKYKALRYLKTVPFYFSKKVGFYANFGHGDTGDDASFLAASELLGDDLIPLSKRCFAFNPHTLKALLLGGGALLRWESPYIPRRLLEKSSWDFPVILLSAGINRDYGALLNPQAQRKITALCERCDYISVRDTLTQEFLAGLGVKDSVIVPDLEFILAEEEVPLNLDASIPTVGISVTSHSELDDALFKKIIKVFSRFTEYLCSAGFRVMFIPFESAYSVDTKEKEVIHSIMVRLQDKRNTVVLENTLTPGQILFAIKKFCTAVVCMRLHSAIFAANAGVPFICVRYNDMHDGLLEMLDAKKLGVSLFEEFSYKTLCDRFTFLQEQKASIRQGIIQKRDTFRRIIRKEAARIEEIIVGR